MAPEMVQAILRGEKSQVRCLVKHKRCHGVPPGMTFADVSRSAYPDGSGFGWILNSNLPSPELETWIKKAYPNNEGINCPYGNVGDRLWVKETFLIGEVHYDHYHGAWEGGDTHQGPLTKEKPTWNHCIDYRATHDDPTVEKWRPSTQMPRWASRILLEIIDVRMERLADISEDDAIAEGVKKTDEAWWNYKATNRERQKGGRVDFASPIASFQSWWEKQRGPKDWKKNEWVWRIRFKRLSPQ